jgi:anti-anti-sigma factor
MHTTPNVHGCEPCSIVVTVEPSVVTLRVSGELDHAAWPSVEQALMSCLVVGCEGIVLDLADVSFVSLSSCEQLHRAIGTLRAARRHVVVELSRTVMHTMRLVVSLGALPASAVALFDG